MCFLYKRLIELSFLFLNCKARAGITEVHFLPFNPTDKRTALTYLDKAGKMHRVSKGAPEQVLSLSIQNPGFIVTHRKWSKFLKPFYVYFVDTQFGMEQIRYWKKGTHSNWQICRTWSSIPCGCSTGSACWYQRQSWWTLGVCWSSPSVWSTTSWQCWNY